MKLEKICIRKSSGCSHGNICDSRGSYIESGKKVRCHRDIYDEKELWRTAYLNVR